jgi:hypothetical protein
MRTNVVEIFYYVDEFCKELFRMIPQRSLSRDITKKTRNRKCRLLDSKVITIIIMFHQMHYRGMKFFYINYIQRYCRDLFPEAVSYNRFVELEQKALSPMVCFLQMCCLVRCTGISFIDSTPVRSGVQKLNKKSRNNFLPLLH